MFTAPRIRGADLRPEALNKALLRLRSWPNRYLRTIHLSQIVLARLTITCLMEQPGGVSGFAVPLDQRDVGITGIDGSFKPVNRMLKETHLEGTIGNTVADNHHIVVAVPRLVHNSLQEQPHPLRYIGTTFAIGRPGIEFAAIAA